MPKVFSENRKYLFERSSLLTPNDTKTIPFSDKSNKNCIQNLVNISNKKNLKEKKLEKPKSLEKSLKINYIKCCKKNHISEITERDKQIVLSYYKKLGKNHNRENDYSKGLVIPVAIKRKNDNKNLNLLTIS
jgi:DNA replicative helicase MCM subunit Mcm2 (Cdc46/Mcm family)